VKEKVTVVMVRANEAFVEEKQAAVERVLVANREEVEAMAAAQKVVGDWAVVAVEVVARGVEARVRERVVAMQVATKAAAGRVVVD
jgi:hypothetical protein